MRAVASFLQSVRSRPVLERRILAAATYAAAAALVLAVGIASLRDTLVPAPAPAEDLLTALGPTSGRPETSTPGTEHADLSSPFQGLGSIVSQTRDRMREFIAAMKSQVNGIARTAPDAPSPYASDATPRVPASSDIKTEARPVALANTTPARPIAPNQPVNNKAEHQTSPPHAAQGRTGVPALEPLLAAAAFGPIVTSPNLASPPAGSEALTGTPGFAERLARLVRYNIEELGGIIRDAVTFFRSPAARLIAILAAVLRMFADLITKLVHG